MVYQYLMFERSFLDSVLQKAEFQQHFSLRTEWLLDLMCSS